MTMRLKGCPRCSGDLFPDGSDREARTYACLQCGYEQTVYAGTLARIIAARVMSPAVPSAA